ncbi:hypothetical protein J4460_08075 [Candidatus Woesearchaeota archaeon]|nr:MAG: hypothetical protein UU20_C0021G0002 [Parcubacteria group bacterium GW2011_GWE2_40_8]MBS3130596.1 hypothetical protein [Candidatus Woesearchaeota archaeon]
MTVSPEVLTASLTLIGGVLIFIIQKFIILLFIQPHQEFKEAKSKVKYLLLLNKNIYTNAFDSKGIKKEFEEYVHNSQRELRREWANLYVKYGNLTIRWLVPKCKDMKTVFDNLIFISNISIIGYSNNKQTSHDCVEVNKKIDNIFKVLR